MTTTFDAARCTVGLELGSTRIKAVLLGPDHTPLAQGDHVWENRLENGVWTYSEADIWGGVQAAWAALAADVQAKFGAPLADVGCIGISAMMHGYLPFDESGSLLVPFRTWRNTITGPAAEALTAALHFNIPQRWSVAHLYQAMLNREEHLPRLAFFTTLAGYVHWKLTGQKVLGVGDASGMFPIDSAAGDYDAAMLATFDAMAAEVGYPVQLKTLLPQVLLAGADAGALTAEAKHGDLTLARFDGDNGEYSLLLGNARGVDGPKGMGTYLWVEVENIKRLEAKIVEGPYIHHCVGIHKDVVPVLYEACKYIGVRPDLYDPIEEQVKAYLRGE